MSQVPVDITRHKKIQAAIAVIVAESWPRGPVPQGHSRLFGDVGEGAIVIVVVEPVLSKVGDVDVRPAVVIIVPDGDAKTPAVVGDACLLGHIGEGAVVVVMEQRCMRRLGLAR